jgi:outer membrane usher protein FimD/PapC
MNWQSSKVKCPTFIRATSQASATFDASALRLNIDSPKKARPSLTP